MEGWSHLKRECLPRMTMTSTMTDINWPSLVRSDGPTTTVRQSGRPDLEAAENDTP